MNRDPECRNTVDQALLAIRDVPLPSDNSRENLTNRTGMEDRPDGNIASVGEQEAATLFPEDFNPSVMNSPRLQKR
jgi:hypothetical protein